MSKLKKKLAEKLTNFLGEVVDPDDILFYRNGRRSDVIRWSLYDYECFESASFCVNNQVKFTILESIIPNAPMEIVAEKTQNNES